MEHFGTFAKDKITGFKGIVTAKASYITGCDQYLLSPLTKEDGSVIEARWFDVGRLEFEAEKAVHINDVTSDQSGCDISAPIK